jgi:hypothetical protein
MRVAATIASRSSSILPILLGATNTAYEISAQSSSKATQSQFLLSNANTGMKSAGTISATKEVVRLAELRTA